MIKMPQQEYFGFGSVKNLKKILAKHKPKNIFLVTGQNSYTKSGAKSILDDYLKNHHVTHFNDFEENPKLKDIAKGIRIFGRNKCDFVIAVGGGSVMDIAKSINALAANPGNSIDYIKNKKNIKNKGKILIAIPTTAGSGSEATKFAVIYIGKTKYSLEHEFILPDYAIVDQQFTISLPKHITASTGMDALSQGIESYWCINSTNESKKYAKEAIKLVMKNLRMAVNKPSKKSRIAMSKAAHLAGKAINISKTTACHAISYPITSYFNVPHGHAVALTLGEILVYNSQVKEEDLSDKRGVDYVKKTIKEITNLLDSNTAEDAKTKIKNLMEEIVLRIKLSDLGIKTDNDINVIIKNGFNPDRVKNNPRRLTEEGLREILNKIR